MKVFIILVVIFGIGLAIGARNTDEAQKITPKEAQHKLETESGVVLLDVRTLEEYLEQHIPGSLLIPLDELEEKVLVEIPNKKKKIIVYCRSGRRSALAAHSLIKLGYKNIFDVGGIHDWPYETQSGSSFKH